MEQSVLSQTDAQAAVLDHWLRASEGIVEQLAAGNSRRSRCDRNRCFNVALGSALECAACLDVAACKHLIAPKAQTEGKVMLRPIAGMIISLREARPQEVKEAGADYGTGRPRPAKIYFSHERLELYQVGLELVGWLDALFRR